MDIIGKIIELRKSKGLTQSLMAEKLGIAPNNYGKIEKGHTELSVSRLNQIADILNVSLSELLIGEQQATHNEERLKELEVYLNHWKELAETRNERLKILSRHLEGYKEILTENLWEILYLKIQDRYPEGVGVPLELAKIMTNSTPSDSIRPMISMLSPDELRQVFRGVIWNDDVLCYAIREGLLGEEGKVFRQYQIEFDKERDEAYKKRMGLSKSQD